MQIRLVGETELQAKAARLCFGLVKNHAMPDANKRLGVHVILVEEKSCNGL